MCSLVKFIYFMCVRCVLSVCLGFKSCNDAFHFKSPSNQYRTHTHNHKQTPATLKTTNQRPVRINKCVENGLNHLPFTCITHITIFLFRCYFKRHSGCLSKNETKRRSDLCTVCHALFAFITRWLCPFVLHTFIHANKCCTLIRGALQPTI